MGILSKEGFEVIKMEGSHIKINKTPSLRRPIIIPNVKAPTNIVRQNLISNCRDAGVSEEILKELNELLRY